MSLHRVQGQSTCFTTVLFSVKLSQPHPSPNIYRNLIHRRQSENSPLLANVRWGKWSPAWVTKGVKEMMFPNRNWFWKGEENPVEDQRVCMTTGNASLEKSLAIYLWGVKRDSNPIPVVPIRLKCSYFCTTLFLVTIITIVNILVFTHLNCIGYCNNKIVRIILRWINRPCGFV